MTTPYSTLSTSLEKTHLLLKNIQKELGWEGREDQALAALRVVLHAIRDRLTIEEAAHMATQLPLVVRGLFYEGWKPSKVPVKMAKAELLDYVRQNFNFEVEGGVERLVGVVWGCLQAYISPGEAEDIRVNLSKDINEILVRK